MVRALVAFILLAAPHVAWAAASAQPLTPANTSVLGGERQVYSVRFFDSLNRPAVGESVTFSNDACGFFDNGGFSTTVLTDASGVASAGFTARAQGITCWIVAQAGVRVTFNVFTYTLGQVSLRLETYPAEPRPGQPFTFTVAVNAGAYPIYGSKPTAEIVPAGAASLAELPGSDAGQTHYSVTRVDAGPFEIEASYRNIARRIVVPAMDAPLQDMWWGGAEESGWGMSLVQHGDRAFVAIYAYDSAGAPTWYVMPGGTWNEDHTALTGQLYSPHGSPYTAYDASRFVVGAPVGTARITFGSLDQATLDYTIGGVPGRKAITRQLFGPPERTAAPVQVGDMWWGGSSQNGWGIALLQQHRTLFGVWFTYGEDGAPTWFVMPSGFWLDERTWQGRFYRATGSPLQAYDAARVVSRDVGGYNLRFDADSATLTYTIDGRSGTLTLSRQAF